MATLVILSGKQSGRKISLPEKELVIGRDEGCFLRLGSSDVSRRHCALRKTSRGWAVRDLGSQNGTRVNEAVIADETLLHPGDLLQVGTMKFAWEVHRPVRDIEHVLESSIADWLSDGETATPDRHQGDTTITKEAAASSTSLPAGQSKAAGDSALHRGRGTPLDGHPAMPGSTAEMPVLSSSEPGTGSVHLAAAMTSSGHGQPPKPKFATVAEEAQDIIRKFKEKTGGHQPPSIARD